jgi:hypothetical protein
MELSIEQLEERFKGTCPAFQQNIKDVAAKAGKDWSDVYRLWRKYCADCQAFDQSAIFSEFLEWNKALLKG